MASAAMVRSIKDGYGGSGVPGLAKVVESAAGYDVGGTPLDYVMQTLLLLLREVCSSQDPTPLQRGPMPLKPNVSIAISLLELSHAPAATLAELRSWAAATSGAEGGNAAEDTEARQLVPTPPSTKPAEHSQPSPKKKNTTINAIADEQVLRQASDGGLQDNKEDSNTWERRTSDEDDRSSESDEGDESDAVGVKRSESLKKKKSIEGLAYQSLAQGSARRVSMADRRRRFTVALAAVPQMLPPMEEIKKLLRPVPAFQGLTEDELQKVAEKVQCRRYNIDEHIATYGSASEALHVITEGTASVSVPMKVGVVQQGDFFGDHCLRLGSCNNTTQVSAIGGPVTTLSLNPSDYQAALPKRQQIAKRKTAKKLKNDDLDTQRKNLTGFPTVPDYVTNQAERMMIIEAVRNNKVLGEVLQLSQRQYDAIVDSVFVIEVQRDEILMKAGDRGTCLFIVLEGVLDVKYSVGAETFVGDVRLRVGEPFGELGLLYDAPRTATVTAATYCKLFVLTRNDFSDVVRIGYSNIVVEYTELLQRIPYLKSLVPIEDLDVVAGVIEEMHFLEGEDVCVEGEDAGLLFIIVTGSCNARANGRMTRTLGSGDYVGEEQLMQMVTATETVTVVSEVAAVLALDGSTLRTALLALQDVKKGNNIERKNTNLRSRQSTVDVPYIDHNDKKTATNSRVAKAMLKVMKKAKKEDCPDEGQNGSLPSRDAVKNCNILGALGEGTFGLVLLMEEKASQKQYALKAVSKEHILREKISHMMKNEHDIMVLLDSPFIVRLFHTYQDGKFVYFLLEPLMGGELFDLYTDENLFGSLSHAKFYISCVTLGLEHMHFKRVIYRDLKLENCLLDNRGYLKLADMGIAKIVIGKTYTVCGTADYFAPETLRQVGHNRAVDWWATGVLLFIMIAGKSPFDAPEASQIYKNIIKGFSKVKIPANFPSDLTDVIKSLCRKQPEERVTMQRGGAQNLKDMGFFSSFDWDALIRQEAPVPFVPPATDLEKIRTKQLTRPLEVDTQQLLNWDGTFGDSQEEPSKGR